ncbi:MAG: lysophospholipid acyltransferase family protein, partial [Chitinophagaceae bacterium]
MKEKALYSLLYLFSLIPLRMMFFFSDILCSLLYYIIRYRKKVVRENLKIAFPEKSNLERDLIMKKFYQNFCDWIFETIKLCSISQKELDKRMGFDIEEFNSYADDKNSMILSLGHLFNWEFAAHQVYHFQNQPVCVNYLPLSSKTMNKILNKIRSRRGALMISATRFYREFTPYARQKHTLILVADQRPQCPENGWWINFFSKPTVFFQGPGKMAHMMDSSFVF